MLKRKQECFLKCHQPGLGLTMGSPRFGAIRRAAAGRADLWPPLIFCWMKNSASLELGRLEPAGGAEGKGNVR